MFESSQLWVLNSFSTTMSSICYTHTHHIRLRERSSVRYIISYGVSTPSDVTPELNFFSFLNDQKVQNLFLSQF